MVSTLTSTPFELARLSANVFEREMSGLFMLEHQLQAHFFELQKKYTSILFQLKNSGQSIDISISPEDSSGLFKIIREAVDNSVQHSGAFSIKAEVQLINNDLIQFSISDNGTGFELDKVAETKRHFGLKRICDFAHQINARVIFNSNIGDGTQIVVAKSIEKKRARFYTRLVAFF